MDGEIVSKQVMVHNASITAQRKLVKENSRFIFIGLEEVVI